MLFELVNRFRLFDSRSQASDLAALDRLAKLAGRLNRTEASILREGLDDVLQKLR